MKQRLSFVAVASLALGLVACSSDVDDASDADAAAEQLEGPWEFTDGSGEVITLDEVPTRIIAHAGEAAALMSYGIRPVGIYASEPVETEPNLAGLDLEGIEILGEEWGSIDVAKAATLDPDLIVADWWPVEEAHSGFEEGVQESSRGLADLAPVVGASQGESILDLAEGYEELAASLGADTENSPGAEDKAAFEAARDEFVALMEGRDITALAVSPAADGLYVANPEYAPELLDFQEWGLGVIDPASPDEDFPYWQTLSWENADTYQPDVLLVDSRYIEDALAVVAAQPTWTSIRAAEADQIIEWPAFWLHTYGDYADALDKLTDDLSGVDDTIGD